MKKTKYPGIFIKYFEKFDMDCFMTSFRIAGKLYPTKNLTMLYGIDNLDVAFDKKRELINAIKRGEDPFAPKEEQSERTISEHWVYEIANYKKKRSTNTIKQYENFYNLYIEPYIGSKKPSEIKTKDIDDILHNTNLSDKSDPYKSLLKRLLRPIMNKAIVDGEISNSVIEAYKFDLKVLPKKKKISRKTKLTHLQIARKLYTQIPQYVSQYKAQREEWQQLMYLQLMCGRRYGELFELTYEDLELDNNRINVYADKNKTQVDTYFPIPNECQDFLANVKSGKVFKEISKGSYYMVFQRLKTLALGTELNFDLTAHDVRSLFMSTLVGLGEDSRKIDYMLDHNQKVELTMNFYLDLTDESCNNAFEKYWNALRDNEN